MLLLDMWQVLPEPSIEVFLSYVADPPRGFASLEKVMKRQWGSRRDTKFFAVHCT